MLPSDSTAATQLRALVPDEVNDLLDEQCPGPLSASFRHQVRRAYVVMRVFRETQRLAVTTTNAEQERVLAMVEAVLTREGKTP